MTQPGESNSRRTLVIPLVAGVLILASGLALARTYLPEWHVSRLPERGLYVSRFQQVMAQAGVRLEPGAPTVELVTRDERVTSLYATLDGASADALAKAGIGTVVKVSQAGSLPGDPTPRDISVDITPELQPVTITCVVRDWRLFMRPGQTVTIPDTARLRLVRTLLQPGESLGTVQTAMSNTSPLFFYDTRESGSKAHVRVEQPSTGTLITFTRGAQNAARAASQNSNAPVIRLLVRSLPPIAMFFLTAGLFAYLLFRRRIDLVNGALFAATALVISLPSVPVGNATTWNLVFSSAFPAFFHTLWLFMLWSASESFLRSLDPEFTTSLDARRAGRLGPRGGRALLAGFGFGAALAGLTLALYAAAVALPGVWPEAPSLAIPAFEPFANPFGSGVAVAGGVMLVTAFARRFLPRRIALFAAAGAGMLLLAPLHLFPLPAELLANLAVVAVLVYLADRFGLTALLTAAVVSFFLPAAIFSAVHLHWLPVTFTATASGLALFLMLGAAGLRRPAEVEQERLKPPTFIRRLEEERRLKYEMDLLARMQLGLQPQSLPQIAGWDLAAQSLLATEAGGDLYDFLRDEEGKLWIAAGDVAGHGYSCSIVHAMTTAALTSLIAPGQLPSEVLRQVDRVIRRGGSRRNFTSLALLRLDPVTGEALLANAGHPFPFL
ncbi:MAG TPA: SpoIIE family protein phosphatase, partial [Thermoanaerobaculia bacterium]